MKTISILIFMSTLAHAENKSIAPEKNPLGNNLMPIEFVQIPAGKFMMGSPPDERFRNGDELLHQVTLTSDFEMQITAVTQAEWYLIMEGAASDIKLAPSYANSPESCPGGWVSFDGLSMCPNHPVDSVTWYEAILFTNRLSEKKGLKPCYKITDDHQVFPNDWKSIYDCPGYRLPTEAEWEYAARAGSRSAFISGDTAEGLGDYAVFEGNNPGNGRANQPADVGSLGSNAFGLYDMVGNLWQWTHDDYRSYEDVAQTNPEFFSADDDKVIRGGAYFNPIGNLRFARRYKQGPLARGYGVGLRLARTIKK